MKDEIGRGDGGLDIRRGTKHSAAGAKVRVLPPRWGEGGEQVAVVDGTAAAVGRTSRW